MFFFFSSRRRHTRCSRDWSSDVCSSDLWLPSITIGIKTMNLARPVSRSLVRSDNLSHVMLRASRSKSRVADAFVGEERRQKTVGAQAGFDGKGFADERRSVHSGLFSRGPHPQPLLSDGARVAAPRRGRQ